MNPERPRRRRRSIGRRILAINVIALLVPVVGLLYLGQYRESLIEAEIETLGVQAEVLAAAVAESSAASSPEDAITLVVPGAAAAMVRRMAEVTGARARLFDLRGVAVADSWLLLASIGPVQREELPPPGGGGPVAWALRLFDRVIDLLPTRHGSPG